MAEQNEPGQTPFNPEPEEETDVLFKAQMWVYDKLMANWKQGLYAVGVVLLGALVYDVWRNYTTGVAEEGSALIADVDRRMPQPDQLALAGLVPLDNLDDPSHVANLEAGAGKYEEAAEATRGVTAAEAWIKAAQVWTRLNKPDKAAAAFQAALDAHDKDIVGFSARAGLASVRESQGDVDGAIAALQDMAESNKKYEGEMSLIRLTELYDRHDRQSEANATIEKLRARFPNSPRVEPLAELIGAPAPLAPAPATPASSAPAVGEG